MKLLLFCSEIFRCLDMNLCFKCNKNVIDTITVYCKWVEGLNISMLCKPFGNGGQSDFFWSKGMFGLMMENPGNFISFFSIAKSVKIINNSLLMTEKRREHFGLRTSEMCLPPAGEGMVCFVYNTWTLPQQEREWFVLLQHSVPSLIFHVCYYL